MRFSVIRLLALFLALGISQLGALADEICGISREVDADTLRVGGRKFRIDGVDAPEFQQPCTDSTGQLWSCGSHAGRKLAEMIGGRQVCCEDRGRDWKHKDRRIGVCRVGEGGGVTDLGRWLVREGLAIDFMPYSCERFKADEDDARRAGRGMWAGCFVAPRAFRYSNVEASLPPEAVSFVPVQVRADTRTSSPTPPCDPSGISATSSRSPASSALRGRRPAMVEVVLTNGRIVKVDESIDAQVLARLLAVVDGGRS
jgi:endonuclease YncB( thermonuclease family)